MFTSRRSPLVRILRDISNKFPEVELKIITASAAEFDQRVADRSMQIGISTDRGKIKDICFLSRYAVSLMPKMPRFARIATIGKPNGEFWARLNVGKGPRSILTLPHPILGRLLRPAPQTAAARD